MAQITITVEFDDPVWGTLSPEEKQEWVDGVVDAIDEIAYVTSVRGD